MWKAPSIATNQTAKDKSNQRENERGNRRKRERCQVREELLVFDVLGWNRTQIPEKLLVAAST